MTPPPRLQQWARELARGEEILRFLAEPGQRTALRVAASRGLPPAEGIEAALLARFGPLVRESRHRLFVAMLADWLAAETETAPPPPAAAGWALAEQLVATLDTAELRQLVQVAQAALRARLSPP